MTAGATADAERQDWPRFAALLLQLAGVTWVIQRFAVESTAFFELMVLTVAGFALHYVLPLRHRLPFFLLLSLAGIGLVLGIVQGAWLVGLGLVLIGIAHLPVRAALRVALLVAACVILFFVRTRLEAPWSAAIWPVLASMFMFRMIVYMYDLSHGQGEAPVTQRLSYFFLLPNVCFPLFPVVDFRTFVRTYYAGPRHEVYQVGVEWIVRGVVQLLLYRVVQLWLSISPYDVDNVFSLGHYFVFLYLLYLSISGQFHVIVGMLHLFGFNLPETHRRYYLASSFTDFWRRINIYWKDFMMKVFYYPIFFRLRRFGQTPALVLSTACVFFLTWALHAYQGFWIRGFFPFTWNDALFWAILCALVIVNSLREASRGRRRTASLRPDEPGARMAGAFKVAGTFAALCVLWSFWSSESLASWFSLWPAALEPPTRHQVEVLLVLAGAGVLGAALSEAWRRFARWPTGGFPARVAVIAVWLIVLGAASTPVVAGAMGPAGAVVASIRFPRLNAFQLEQLERGYYEDLLTVDRFNRELAGLYSKRPPEWERTLVELGASVAGAEPGRELRPHVEVRFKGATFRTNQWGLHDKDYDQKAPPGTYRIALLGASHVMGMGVERDSTFEALLEDQLNRQAEALGAVRFEILNFAYQGYTPFDQIRLLETKVAAFAPNAVWYVGHPYELKRVVRVIRNAIQGAPAPGPSSGRWPWFEDLAAEAAVDERTSVYLAERRLAALGDRIFLELFGTIVGFARQHDMRPVYVHMPLTPGSRNEVDDTRYVELAGRSGFVTLDLTGVYDGYDQDALWIAEWDAHPNELGHQLVARRLSEMIQQQKIAVLGGVTN